MPKKPTHNVYATFVSNPMIILPLDQYFANAIDEPPYIEHSRITDRLDIKNKFFRSQLSKGREDEEKKFDEVNNIIEETQRKQVEYILTEVAKRAGSDLKEVDKFLGKHPNQHTQYRYTSELTGDAFLYTLNKLKVKHDESGNKILDSHGKEVTLTDEEIYGIIKNSTLEQNIGKSDKKYYDLMIYNRTSLRQKENTEYKNRLKNTTLQNVGYTEDELDRAFNDCFYSYPTQVLYGSLKNARMNMIKARLQRLPENERNERAFVSECEKLDIALNVYVFPKNDVELNHKELLGSITREEYEKFALNNIPPVALAKQMETAFDDIVDPTREKESVYLSDAVKYIDHLQQLHEKRSWWTRFKDYFKKDGEDSTIKRMRSKLNQMGFDNEEIKDAIDGLGRYDKPSFEDRFDTVIEDNEMQINENVWEPLLDDVNALDKNIDDVIKQREEMKEKLNSDIKEDEKDTEIVNEKADTHTMEKTDVNEKE